ncbi:MAG: hypothetical protein IJ002_08770 [Clostridia bacterium]|nr:hypothetical protein [Clostridia bacterium]
MKVVTGMTDPIKTPIREYYPISYIEDFCEKELSISLSATGTATATYSAEYVTGGIKVYATVVDPVIYTSSGSVGSNDNVTVHLQAANSIMRGDRFAVYFQCDAGGNYKLCRYSDADGGFAAVTSDEVADPSAENDTFYYTYEKTYDGYKVSLFASYDFLRMPEGYAFGKTRMLLSLRNTDSADSTNYYVYGSDEGVSYDMPNTWLVLDKDNNFTRDDFDTVSFKEDMLSDNEFADLKFLDSLAVLEAGEGCTLRETKAGASLFSNRTYISHALKAARCSWSTMPRADAQ